MRRQVVVPLLVPALVAVLGLVLRLAGGEAPPEAGIRPTPPRFIYTTHVVQVDGVNGKAPKTMTVYDMKTRHTFLVIEGCGIIPLEQP